MLETKAIYVNIKIIIQSLSVKKTSEMIPNAVRITIELSITFNNTEQVSNIFSYEHSKHLDNEGPTFTWNCDGSNSVVLLGKEKDIIFWSDEDKKRVPLDLCFDPFNSPDDDLDILL